jgi:copper chaperone CopZ
MPCQLKKPKAKKIRVKTPSPDGKILFKKCVFRLLCRILAAPSRILSAKGALFMESMVFSLTTPCTKHDAKTIKKGLDEIKGIRSVSIGKSGRIAVDYDETGVRKQNIENKMKELGYEIF